MTDQTQVPPPAPQAPAPAAPAQQKKGFAVTALVLGIVAILGSWIPFLSIGSAFIAIVGLVFGIIAIVKAFKGTAGGKVMAIVGAALAFLALIFSALSTGAGVAAVDSAIDELENETSSQSTTEDIADSNAEPSTDEPAVEVVALELNASGIMGGVGYPTEFDAGTPGEVTVVWTAAATDESDSIPLVLRNMTESAVTGVDIAATVRDADGTLVGSGSSQGTTPAQIEAGGLALAYVYVGDPVAEGFTADFTIDWTPVDDAWASGLDLRVTELAPNEDGFVGTAINDHDVTVAGPISVDVYCFTTDGDLVEQTGTYTDQDEVDPGGTASFTVDFYGDPCPAYIVGVSGYDF